MYGKLNIINNTFRREQWNASSCTIWYRLQYVICPLMPHPWYWSGYHMVHEDVQIEISFRWYQLIGTKKFLNSAELGEKFFVSMCFDYTCRLTWFIQTFNLSFWISDIIKCDINVPWSVNNKSFVITTKNRKNSWKCFLYGGCTRTVKKKNWSQMTKNAQREGLVNCCNL